jgi:hypothetical protein
LTDEGLISEFKDHKKKGIEELALNDHGKHKVA